MNPRRWFRFSLRTMLVLIAALALLGAVGADWYRTWRTVQAAYKAQAVAYAKWDAALTAWTEPAQASRRWCQLACRLTFTDRVAACRLHLDHANSFEHYLVQGYFGFETEEEFRDHQQQMTQAIRYRQEAEAWLAKAQHSPRWKALTLTD